MSTRCVGAVARDRVGRLLVIRRAHEPGSGQWSIPGGHVEPGETDAQALRREVREETGLLVEVGSLAGAVTRPGAGGETYEIYDYRVSVVGGVLHAGDDAGAARWVTDTELAALPVAPGLIDALTAWGVLTMPPATEKPG